MNVSKALAFQIAQRAAELLTLLPDDVLSEISIRSLFVSILANSLTEIENDGNWNHVVLACECDERLARLGLDVSGVDYCQFAGRETFGGDEVQDFEGVFGGRLVVLVVRNEPAAEVGGDDFGWFEVCGGKRRLTTAGRTDEDH